MKSYYVIHSGSAEDLSIVKLLKSTFRRPDYYLEVIEYRSHQQKEAVMYYWLKERFENNHSVIAIISTEFFDVVWPSSYKKQILSYLTKPRLRNCMHIWSNDVDRNLVWRHSSDLIAQTPYFESEQFSMLEKFPKAKLIDEFDKVLSGSKFNDRDLYENFCVQTHDRENFSAEFAKQRSGVGRSSNTLTDDIISTTENGSAKAETDANGTGASNSPDEGSKEKASKRSKKKKKKKQINGAELKWNEENLLTDLPYGFRMDVSQRLDVGYGHNWKALAAEFGYSNLTIATLERGSHVNGSPSESLLHKLATQYPKLTVKEFIEKCSKIQREDVVELIKQKLS